MSDAKVLFTDRCRRQNFRPSLLHIVDRLYTVIYKTQKTRTRVLQRSVNSTLCDFNKFKSNILRQLFSDYMPLDIHCKTEGHDHGLAEYLRLPNQGHCSECPFLRIGDL
jgi:hypothetical protein